MLYEVMKLQMQAGRFEKNYYYDGKKKIVKQFQSKYLHNVVVEKKKEITYSILL